MMRAVNIALGVMLLFFATLQYDDPDPYWWGPAYLLAAAFPLLALRRGNPLGRVAALRAGGMLCVGLFLLGFLSLADTIGADWIHVEEAREAFGYLICAASVGFALFASRRRRAARLAAPGT
jgi:hypothetical protein